MKNYVTSITSTISNDPAFILSNLTKENEPEGYPSIYNALNVCAEFSGLVDKVNTDVVFFYSSLNSFDRGSVYELIEYFVDMKIEINCFTFETPFDLLYVRKSSLNI